MDGQRRGRLHAGTAAPATGETTTELASCNGVVVEQILSGRLDAPVDYLAEVAEWLVVLEGKATLAVDGEPVELRAGDWLLLPAHTPHSLIETVPGTSWLTVTGRA